tara:strand:- start:31606 stop:32289 length:684 start_codon:yes stop_codon:yes gene_type:complete
MTISTLIDKLDTFEIVRDQIAQILADEVASQMAIATSEAKDPDDWKLRIFTERSNPWEQFQNPDQQNFDKSPIVNVWFDNNTFDMGSSNILERQKTDGVFNIDCYGFGRSKDDGGTGHIPGDKEAALEVQRAIRLVRNILMAAEYTYLSLRGTVWQRWPQSITVFQPQLDSRTVQQLVGARLALRVAFNEFSPQVESVELEAVRVDVLRAENGEIVAQSGYDYPLTP